MKMKPTPRPPTPRRVPKRLTPRRVLPARAASSNDEVDDYDAEAEPNMKLSHAFIVVLLLHVLAVGGVFAFNTLKPGQPSSERKTKAEAQATQSAAPIEPKVETSNATAKAPAKAAAEPKPTASIVPGATYTVVAGDTLTKIASLHKTSVESLEKANNLETGSTIRVGQQLTIPQAGTTAAAKQPTTATPVASSPKAADKPTAPKAEETKPAVAERPAPEGPAASSGSTYVVEKGDNPYSIAKKLKVSYTELLKVNNIDDPKKLQIGQKLIVP